MTQLGTKVDPRTDHIQVDGDTLRLPQSVTYLLYKPRGVITTLDDPQGRRTVADFLPPDAPIVRPVGRLDYDSEGLLLLTNDGDLAMRLTSARYKVDKEYEVKVRPIPPDNQIERLRRGIVLDGRKTSPVKINVVGRNEKSGVATLIFTLHEGRNRQIRRMIEAVGSSVTMLKRVRIGFLGDKGLTAGQVVRMGEKDMERLRQSVGL